MKPYAAQGAAATSASRWLRTVGSHPSRLIVSPPSISEIRPFDGSNAAIRNLSGATEANCTTPTCAAYSRPWRTCWSVSSSGASVTGGAVRALSHRGSCGALAMHQRTAASTPAENDAGSAPHPQRPPE
jgi:hypothetical protein